MNIIKSMIVSCCFLGMLSCGDGGITTVGNPTGGGDSTGSMNDETLFYDAVQLVAPSFAPETSSAGLTLSQALLDTDVVAAVTTSWGSGNPVYELFYILREFNSETDQGVIDTSNLYKTMWEGKNFFSSTKTSCSAITAQTITPPFDFGNEATSYNCAYNKEATDGYDFGGALKELDADGNIIEISDGSSEAAELSAVAAGTTAVVKHGLFGFVWVDSSTNPHNEYGVLQGVLNSTTSELSLDIAVWVDYTGQNDYCYRNDIDGNTETHTFTFRSIKGNLASNFSYTTLVGKGISQGSGKYFLVKMTTDDISGKYYCIEATDGEIELKVMSAGGSDTVDANCSEYQEAVDALIPFTTSDLSCQSSDLNTGGTGTAAEGTIFLNFQ